MSTPELRNIASIFERGGRPANSRREIKIIDTTLHDGHQSLWATRMRTGGQPLNIAQDGIIPTGHAIECRINAEDPAQDFSPRPGTIERFRAPGGFGVRLDTHIETGYAIPPFYDSMVGKLICWGKDRDEAIARSIRALDELHVEGIPTTAGFHKGILSSEEFQSGEFNTAIVSELTEQNNNHR